jgi:hypothetical protein
MHISENVASGRWPVQTGPYLVKEGPVDVELYGFLTAQPNAVVKPIHEKAMPVILRSQDEMKKNVRTHRIMGTCVRSPISPTLNTTPSRFPSRVDH